MNVVAARRVIEMIDQLNSDWMNDSITLTQYNTRMTVITTVATRSKLPEFDGKDIMAYRKILATSIDSKSKPSRIWPPIDKVA